MTSLVKICSECKQEKSLKEFTKDLKGKNNLCYWCKDCLKKYRKEHKEEIKILNTSWYQKMRIKYPHKMWVKYTIIDHRRKGYTVNIKNEELVEVAKKTTHCPICNNPLNWDYKTKNGKTQPNSPNLDRTNNGKILTLKNTQIICRKCNSTKLDRTMKEFINYCSMVHKKFGGV